MAGFTPAFPYTTPAELLIPTYSSEKGTQLKTFPAQGVRINVSFRSFGGTETNTNEVYTVLNTATVETWYRPDIKADCRIRLASGEVYEIIGTPENIELRNQFCKFKVKAIEGNP